MYFAPVPKQHAIKTQRECRGSSILFLDLKWRWVISFTLRLIYLNGKSPRYPNRPLLHECL